MNHSSIEEAIRGLQITQLFLGSAMYSNAQLKHELREKFTEEEIIKFFKDKDKKEDKLI